MSVELLSDSQAAELRHRRLTYSAVGRVLEDSPPGYNHISRSRRLETQESLNKVGDKLLSWQVQARSGLRVAASALIIDVDVVVLMRFGIGPARISIPCRVVAVFDEINRRGFSYGTLPGHPESGEEAFVLDRHPDGSIHFTITAFSRPVSLLARLGGPVSAQVQRRMTTRYLHALD